MKITRNVALSITLLAACAWTAAVAVPRAQAPAAAVTTVLRFGSVWDGTKVTRNAVVVVEGDRVKSIGSGTAALPADAALEAGAGAFPVSAGSTSSSAGTISAASSR